MWLFCEICSVQLAYSLCKIINLITVYENKLLLLGKLRFAYISRNMTAVLIGNQSKILNLRMRTVTQGSHALSTAKNKDF